LLILQHSFLISSHLFCCIPLFLFFCLSLSPILDITFCFPVFQWGDIGIGRRFSDRQKKNKLTPSRVTFKRVGTNKPPKKIVSVYAGGHSTFALDEEGTAWFWGPNNYSQGGRSNPDKNGTRTLLQSLL
jgi:hypothetical protein